jgi:hypothetical protein
VRGERGRKREKEGERGRKREKEGEREQQINGVREGALVRNGNIAGWKCPLVKKNN